MPGGAQTITPGPGAIQFQPAFTSVSSVTPWESAVSPREAVSGDSWESAVSPEETASADGIALGLDGDVHAPMPNPPNTTNKVHARLNIFAMLDLS
jgi:hypothetical protein